MTDYLINLGVSDVCAGWPGIGPYAAIQAAHTLIGGLAVFTPLSLRLVILGGWIGKELFSDMARCDLSVWVALDSVADMACAVIGFALVSATLRHSQWTSSRKLS